MRIRNQANFFECANMAELIYKELSFKIMGVLFKVQNKLGTKYQEKYYQRAIESELKRQNISFEREKLVRLSYEGESIGRYFIDFIIEGKIALETKALDFFRKSDFKQVLGYLEALNLKLAIIVNFQTPRLSYKRILNSRVKLK